jgi:hypothetical protein
MTPIEKAKELVDKFRKELKWVELDYPVDLYRDMKQCTLIAVDEIIESQPSVILVSIDGDETEYMDKKQYWQQVRTEIEQL